MPHENVSHDEPAGGALPEELAELEDTVFRDVHERSEEPPHEGGDGPDVNGNGTTS